MEFLILGQRAYREGRIAPSNSDCLEFARAKNPLMARDDFFLGIGYAMAAEAYKETGKQISARDALDMVQQ